MDGWVLMELKWILHDRKCFVHSMYLYRLRYTLYSNGHHISEISTISSSRHVICQLITVYLFILSIYIYRL